MLSLLYPPVLEGWLSGILQILISVALHYNTNTLKKILNSNSFCIIGVKIIPINFSFEYNFLRFIIFQLFNNKKGIRDSNEIEISEIPAPDEQLQFFRAFLTRHTAHTSIDPIVIGEHFLDNL
jgi:hypothetical protein